MRKLMKLFKNSKKNSLYGKNAKRKLTITLMAMAFIMTISGMCFASESAEGVVLGVSLATFPIVGFAIPERKDKLIDAIRASMTVTDDQVAFVNAVEKSLEAREKLNFDAYSENLRKALKEVLGEIPQDENGKMESVAVQLRAFAETVEKMEKTLKKNVTEDFKSNLRKSVLENHEKINEQLKAGTFLSLAINTRDAVLMTTENTVIAPAGGYPLGVPLRAYNEIRYPQNFIIDIIGGRQVATVPKTIVERNQDSEEGGAEIVPEGGLKPKWSTVFKDVVYKSRKIAAHMQYTDELKNDPERLYAKILSLFENRVIRDWQDLTLDWVIAQASPYVSSTLDETQRIPTVQAALSAMALQISGMLFNPDVTYMNPADIEAAKWTQNADGIFITPPVGNLGTSLNVFASNSIPVGYALVGDSSTIKEEHSNFILKIGLINDQLIHNEETAVGEIFQLLYQNEFFDGSWIYSSLDVVKEALHLDA